MNEWHLILMAGFYTAAGVNHFVNPRFYERIIPPVLKYRRLLNGVAGIAEVLLGILLMTKYQPAAAWGIIVLLILVFPANVYHLIQNGAGMKIPRWVLWARLPLQLVLIAWAYQYT